MNFMRETEQYYDWLYKIVCGEWEPRNLSFHRLLMYLFNRDYIPACEMDVCRATDGINLRYRFASENNIPYGKIDAVFQGVPCSMLEMMVALAIRIEEHIMEDRSITWESSSIFSTNPSIGMQIFDSYVIKTHSHSTSSSTGTKYQWYACR